MLMMMMMMKKKGSKFLAVVALLLASANCISLPSKEDLNQISLQGEKYLDKQIENAVNGVKEMKSVMQKSSEEHQKFLDALEKTKEQKEEALRVAKEKEAKLEQEEGVCNETMTALWEECKPCLKTTCVKYYSRTCSSGSGLVGRQLEEVLNRSSPFSIWINGEKIDVMQQEGQRQSKEFRNLEEKYSEMADGVDNIFTDSMKDLFSPMRDISRNIFSSMGSMMNIDSDAPPNEDGSVNEDVVITKPFGDGRMTCREIRRNSAGCLKFREECQKCKEIQHIDCSGKRPLDGPLKQELEEALAMAERFTQQYNSLLKTFEETMLNTSSILDLLNREFGWVSSLANTTKDYNFQVQMVNSRGDEEKPSEGEKKQPGETNVSVQLFDNPPINFSVPGDIPWTDPKFSEVVAQKALDHYKETSVVV
ncbi:hypothetical protein FQN60_015548 [Etheostoma spectabile]|uniref:Clusterin n=1 Tax=Etheostoma spectabile TaxID=54343 RepID=A0A5J5CM65_9PERO|nr:hypothetical protein FQN60_015548 [Etheostoma spectabile]